ncbi:MAG: response regulator receiver domain [Silvibacterium sp.]
MPVETAFLESSRSIVKAFLSSAVLVDDQAYFVPHVEDTAPTKLIAPGKQGATRIIDPAVSPQEPADPDGQSNVAVTVDLNAPAGAIGIPDKSTTNEQSSKRDHTLDGKTVIDVFARIGIVCAVVRPTKEELAGLSDLVMNVGANADVVILDWVLHDSKFGERTLELIERMVASSVSESGRARLIVVYTAEPKLVDIERGIRKHLKLEEENPTDSLTITAEGTRICVYGKAGVRPAPIGEDRLKTPSELADVVVSEFTEMTKGLLSNVAMKSITAIRAKTFQLLRRFDCNVDAPYVTQSALISPERAEEQVAALIVSEIQEILEDENVGALADYDHIIQWLDDRIANGLTLPAFGDLTSDQYRAGLIQLVKDGVRKSAVQKLKTDHAVFASKILPGREKPAMYVRDVLTGILRSNPPLPHEADEILTMLMSLRHRYTNPEPQLVLGTIVARTSEDGQTYLLCLQPVCDSVRLPGSRPFAFLSLKPADNHKYCELIVRDGGQLKFLALKPSPFMLEMISFSPNRNEKVMADLHEGGFVFSSTEGLSFRWIADLKPAHAQRIANNFAHTFSRVGLVESEWNRLGSNL